MQNMHILHMGNYYTKIWNISKQIEGENNMKSNPEMLKEIIKNKGKVGFSIPEAANMTGLSKSYLYKLSSQNVVPVSSFGNRRVILVDDLISFCLSAKRRGGIN